MDEKDFLEQLETLKTNLEGKSKEQADKAVAEFKDKFKADFKKEFDAEVEEKVKNLVGEEVKTAKEQVEADYNQKLKVVQDHADKLDLKLQAKGSKQTENVTFESEVKNLLDENFGEIKEVRKGNSHKFEIKAPTDMTLGAHLTGDQPRSYSQNVAAVPAQLVNFVDLLGPSIVIDGGTYTFPKETGSEGVVATQTEGALKSQLDYDFTMVDVNTDFLAGFTVYSKKMRNNLPFLQSFLPRALRRDYFIAENSLFNTTLAAAATASTQVITGQNQVEMLIGDIATLEGANFNANGVVLRPADWYAIATTEKSTGSGYGLPGIVNYSAGTLTINGIPIFKANWIGENKYYVGDWSQVQKVVTEGLTLEFSEQDVDNFRKNNITAKIEAQIALAIERDDAIIYGDFTAV